MIHSIDAQGAALSPGLLQYAWSHVPVEHRSNAKALAHPALFDDLLACCGAHVVPMPLAHVFGVPVKADGWMGPNIVLIAEPEITGDLFVIVKNLNCSRTFTPAAAKCVGCDWRMSITETERGQTYCNRCESLLWDKWGAANRNIANMSARERVDFAGYYHGLPMPPNIDSDFLYPQDFYVRT